MKFYSCKKNIIVQNKKIYSGYTVENTIEAGIVLIDSEAKSLRFSEISISESYAEINRNNIYLTGINIPKHNKIKYCNYSSKRKRKLLLHKNEIKKLIGVIKRENYNLIPLSLYFNKKNIVKVLLGIVKKDKMQDKRQSIKEKNWQKYKSRIIKISTYFK